MRDAVEIRETDGAAADRSAALVLDYEFDVELASHPPHVRRLLYESIPLLGAPGDPGAIPELQAAIARVLGVGSRNVVLFAGSKAAMRAILGKVDRYVKLPLCYPGFVREAEAMGRHAPEGTCVPDVERGADELRDARRTVLFVDSPSYFTGARVPLEQAIRASLRARGDNFVVVDSSGTLLFHPDPRYVSSPRLIFLGSFSKIFSLAGLKLAFAVGPAELLEELRSDFVHMDLSAYLVHVAPRLLDELPHYHATHRERRGIRSHNVETLRRLLRDHVVDFLSSKGHSKLTFLSRIEKRSRLIELVKAAGLPHEALEFHPRLSPPGLDLATIRPYPARHATFVPEVAVE
jgi:histidinol-phosphate/aromatic aminotransferase/cobyric acid decarboxylase-like protein